jgi:predicted Zn-dependent protease
LGKDAKAAEVALDLTKSYPDDPEILYHSSRLFANYAYLAMRRLTEAAPDSVWRMLASGEIHESQGNRELAIAAYREVLAKEPTRPGVYYRIGRTLLAGRDPASLPEARSAFEKELENDPTNANAAYELGELDRKAGDLDKARRRFEAALQQDSSFVDAAIALGRTLLALDKADLALVPLRRAVTLDAGNDVAFYHLAQAYRKLGDAANQQKALAEFRRLREQRAARDTALIKDVTPQEADLAGTK